MTMAMVSLTKTARGRQPGEAGYTNDLVNDDDENGLPDDIQGWNWIGVGQSPSGPQGTNNLSDDNGHGTHVAGITAAHGNNSLGLMGVAPGCRVMALKIFQIDGIASTDNIVKAVDYARRKGANVINMSFAGPSSQLLYDALALAYNQAVLVAAAGNGEACQAAQYPAHYPFVIGAGASSGMENADFSNLVSADIFAPGEGIRGPLPQ